MSAALRLRECRLRAAWAPGPPGLPRVHLPCGMRTLALAAPPSGHCAALRRCLYALGPVLASAGYERPEVSNVPCLDSRMPKVFSKALFQTAKVLGK